MFTHFLDNLANILFLYLILNQIDELEARAKPKRRPLFDVLRIFSISLLVVLMFESFLYDGYFFDLRMLPLFILSFLRGYRIAIPVLILVASYRIVLSGAGMIPGILFGIAAPTIIGLIGYSGGLDFFNRKHFYPLFLLNWIVSFGTILILPIGSNIMSKIGLSHFLTYLVAGIGLHKLFADQFHRKLADIALREAEEQLEKIISIIPDALLVVRKNGEILYASPSAGYLFSTSDHHRLLGSSILEKLNEESKASLLKKLGEIEAGKEPELEELLIKREEGTPHFVEMNGRAIHYQGGKAILLVFRDITERKKTEEEIRNLDKLSMVGQLAAGIAHEIRNPLTSLKGFLQLMEEGGETKEYIPIMLAELERINLVTSELLLLSKPQMVQYRKQDIVVLLSEVISLLRTEGNLKGIEISLKTLSSVEPMYCEANQLKQVFINLIKNAIDATPHGGNIHIIVEMANQDMIRISIRDEGVGIAPELLSRLGKPFYTTKEKGTGLGLTVCFQIVRAHRGELQFESEPGKGTTVTILLPVSLQKT
ncbi:putative Histidine kinase [[Clostridium] ultunense Esp]|nr:putative Histidine kinase [[Clostridium] ultunense Esp]